MLINISINYSYQNSKHDIIVYIYLYCILHSNILTVDRMTKITLTWPDNWKQLSSKYLHIFTWLTNSCIVYSLVMYHLVLYTFVFYHLVLYSLVFTISSSARLSCTLLSCTLLSCTLLSCTLLSCTLLPCTLLSCTLLSVY